MRVFVTGASGWIGSATVDELLGAGHQVVGLARSDASAASLEAKGVTVLRGDLDDLDALRRGAADADAVAHLANKHDWNNPAESNRAERAAVETLAEALAGSDRPFVSPRAWPASPRAGRAPRRTRRPPSDRTRRAAGARTSPSTTSTEGSARSAPASPPPSTACGDHGFIAYITAAARRHGVSAYVGDGSAAWSAVHRSDAARLVRLGLEQAPAGSRLHAVAEEAIPTREIAEAIAEALGVPVTSIAPEDAVEHFGFIGRFFALDMSASSNRTRELLDWTPTGPTLIEDIKAGAYTGA